MNKLTRILLMAVSFSLFAIGFGSLAGRPAVASGSAPVMVTNTPLPVQGMIGVNNFPTNQAVSGTVNVGNFPPVQPVSFSNSGASPLYVRDVDGPAHHPFAAADVCQSSPGFSCSDSAISVPSGTELVIETVGVSVTTASGLRPVVAFAATTNGTSAQFPLPLTFRGTTNGIDEYAIVQSMRVYADGGTSLIVGGRVDGGSASADFGFQFSGYLVSCNSSGQGICPP